jgi:hypothetical protein
MSRLLALAVGSLALAATPAGAERYEATSKTAMAITGDISMDDFAITFANGKSLKFDELVSDSFVVGGETVGASVYSVKSPADPVLLHGNRLCGEGKVTYLATYGAGDGMTAVAVFTTQDAPSSDAEMCASYTYADR